MEKEKNEEIIAYRIGKGLYCPDCNEEIERVFKKVQDPDDPKFKIPSKPITGEDVKAFICKQCKAIKGPSARELEIKIQEQENLTKLRINLVGEASNISLRTKLIKRNLDAVHEGRPLSRKSMLTLRRFFDGLAEKIDLMRGVITCSILDDILSPH